MQHLIALAANMHRGHLTPYDTVAHAIWHLPGAGFEVRAQSRIFRAPAEPQGCSPDFAVAAVLAHSAMAPVAARQALDRIEAALGHAQPLPGAARALTIGLIGEGDCRHAADAGPAGSAHLVPLAEIAPDWPSGDGRSLAQMLAALESDMRAAVSAVDELPAHRDVAE